VKRIFRNKPDLLIPLLGQLEQSYRFQGEVNLSTVYLTKYLHLDGSKPVIVLWNGETDKVILDRLKIQNIHKILNITTYDEYNDGEFLIKLTSMKDKKLIYSKSIGKIKKNGRMLNLGETHKIICKVVHKDVTHCHDPVTDVIYTKCLFNFIINCIGPSKLYRICSR